MTDNVTDTRKGFTPGPWHIFASSFADGRDQVEINAEDGLTVAYAVKFVPAYAEESKANAHLIAAAPALYEALDKLDSFCRGEPGNVQEVMDAAANSLKQARGEA